MLTGVAAHDHAGPGVVLSYTFGAVAAMLTAFCYAGACFLPSCFCVPSYLEWSAIARNEATCCIHLHTTEFAADFPVAGGAFNYISLTFGEFAAWVAACDLILEYTLSAAAVAKGFTAYLASLLQVGGCTNARLC